MTRCVTRLDAPMPIEFNGRTKSQTALQFAKKLLYVYFITD